MKQDTLTEWEIMNEQGINSLTRLYIGLYIIHFLLIINYAILCKNLTNGVYLQLEKMLDDIF